MAIPLRSGALLFYLEKSKLRNPIKVWKMLTSKHVNIFTKLIYVLLLEQNTGMAMVLRQLLTKPFFL